MADPTELARNYTWENVWEDPDSGEIEFQVRHHIGEPELEQVESVLYEEGDLWPPNGWAETTGEELTYFSRLLADMLASLPQYSTVFDGAIFGLPER